MTKKMMFLEIRVNQYPLLLILWAAIGVMLGLLAQGCAPHAARQAANALDSPEHHVFLGEKFFKEERLDEAGREFNLALELEPRHSAANCGLGLVLGYNGDFESAFKAMDKALDYGRNPHERALARVGYMRLYSRQKDKKWLAAVRKNFRSAIGLEPDMPEAHYYMGLACKEALEFTEATTEFSKVLTIDKLLTKEADEQLALLQKIQRAMPGTVVGKELALREKITRAELAAVLVQELRLAELFAMAEKKQRTRKVNPADIKDHCLQADLETVLSLDVRGLEPLPNQRFAPDALLTRSGYAMVVEDVISGISHDPALSVRHLGTPSPFPDVPNDAPYFNAVMVCCGIGGCWPQRISVPTILTRPGRCQGLSSC